MFVTLGSYPGAFAFRHDFSRFSAYIRDSIIEPAIGRDLLALSAIRRPALLRQLFAVCAISPTQIVSLQKMQGQLQGDGALETLSSYLDLLAEAHLVAPLEKFSKRPLRRRSSPPKLVPLNNALITVMTPGILPTAERDPARFGVWVENACLAYAWNAGQHVTYFREEPFEVDGILEGSWGQWAVEVKTGKFSAGDLKGLLEFNRLHPDYVPLVVCDPGMEKVAHRIGVQSLSWHRFLLSSSLEKTSVSPMMHR